jgi:hypothetical protein
VNSLIRALAITISLGAIFLILTATPNTTNAGTCSAQAGHRGGSVHFSGTSGNPGGSCSIAASQSALHGQLTVAGNDPGFKTANCASSSSSTINSNSHADDGQSSGSGSCSASSHSP